MEKTDKKPKHLFSATNQPDFATRPRRGKSLKGQLRQLLKTIPPEEKLVGTNRTYWQLVCLGVINGAIDKNPQMVKVMAQVLGELIEKQDHTTAGQPMYMMPIPTHIPDEDE